MTDEEIEAALKARIAAAEAKKARVSGWTPMVIASLFLAGNMILLYLAPPIVRFFNVGATPPISALLALSHHSIEFCCVTLALIFVLKRPERGPWLALLATGLGLLMVTQLLALLSCLVYQKSVAIGV